MQKNKGLQIKNGVVSFLKKINKFLIKITPSPLNLLLLIALTEIVFTSIFDRSLGKPNFEITLILIGEISITILTFFYIVSIAKLTIENFQEVGKNKNHSKIKKYFFYSFYLLIGILYLILPTFLSIYWNCHIYYHTDISQIRQLFFNTLKNLEVF